MSDLIQNVSALWAVVAGLGGFASGIFLSIWRVSRYVALNDERMGKMAHVVGEVTKAADNLSKDFISLHHSLQAREKDVLRLEGVAEATRRDLMETTRTLERTTSKIEAMWFTLQKLFPDQVPARVVDRK